MPPSQPRPAAQIAVIWILAIAAELFLVARLVARLRMIDAGLMPPLGGATLLLNLVALLVVPAAAVFVTRMLRRERAESGSSRGYAARHRRR